MTHRLLRSLASFDHGQRVMACCDIADNPAAKVDSSAKRGEIGYVDDIDHAGELIMVDFGRGSIACSVGEITPAPTPAPAR